METKELFLKTVFSCMASDGDIANQEVQLVKNLASTTALFDGMDVENKINQYIKDINQNGVKFLSKYLEELRGNNLSIEDQMTLVDLAFKTIEADNVIEYVEVKFFKKIRNKLTLSDEEILKRYPDKEDYLLPDINISEDIIWNNITFNEISLNKDIS